MDLEIITLTEVSDRDGQMSRYHLYVESRKMTQINLLIKQKETHRHGELMVTKGERRVGGINHELGIGRHKPPYIK